MPKMYLKFDLMEDKEVSDIYYGAYGMYHMLSQLKHELRQWHKYGSPHKTAEEAIEAIYERFFDIQSENNVGLDF